MNKCKFCGSDTKSVISLGHLPLANSLLKNLSNCNDLKYNLEVMLCSCCSLAQLKDTISPKELFEDYVYFSSNSETMLKSAKELANRISKTLTAESLVIEIASNDGYLLKNYVENNIKVLGIEPAKNIAKVAASKGINTLCDFFNKSLAKRLLEDNKQADIIHANNVMAHVPDINDFVAGLKMILKPHGKIFIEVPYFVDLYQKLEFDTIYHEHVYYFLIKPLRELFEKHNLEIFDIEKLAIHGGTLRLHVSHINEYPVSKKVYEMLEAEQQLNLYSYDTFLNFSQKLNSLKGDLLKTLSELKSLGKKIAGYGASAKGTTLLNYFNIDNSILDFVVDRSEAKIGLYTPGTHLEIKKPNALIDEHVDYALLLTWNFTDEIMEQQQEYIKQGGKFILPLPEVKILP